ncbi:hypothetical protein [Amycolatopsis anabasis]|uniref:hypothetical protein n=1 Tax=Amycolatopsis anabasis TaxID=1840409 RepID=UPI00131B7F98|nr:hypothetical protein [Amycolatopsis anabasis]
MPVPPGGVKSAMTGGNTIGAALREAVPRADGYRHIDSPRLVERLRAANVNTYTYGIWDSPTDWDDLRLEFLPAAEQAGLAVWVYLVPPSESFEGGRSSRPFGQDYLAWAREIATLSTQYPNLTGWGIDDFHIGQNRETFTPEYVRKMREIHTGINPGLQFWLCAYHDAATDVAFVDTYRPYIDGLIYPYLDDPFHNTENAASMAARLDDIRAITAPRGLGLVALVYCGRFLDTMRDPTEAYVRDCLRTGLAYAADGRIQGVLAYGLPVDGTPLPASENRAMYGFGRLSFTVPARTRTAAGNSAWAEQRVRVDPDAPRHELSFWHRSDKCTSTSPTGYHVKQVLLNGQVVWSSDVAGPSPGMWLNGHDWQGPIDVTEHLRGGRPEATLTVRLVEQREVTDFGIDAGFDHFETIGFTVANPDFETLEGWTFGSDHGGMHAGIDLAPPDRPQRIHAAVAEAFAG